MLARCWIEVRWCHVSGLGEVVWGWFGVAYNASEQKFLGRVLFMTLVFVDLYCEQCIGLACLTRTFFSS